MSTPATLVRKGPAAALVVGAEQSRSTFLSGTDVSPRNQASAFVIVLISCPTLGSHGIRLTRSGLSVRKDGHVIPLVYTFRSVEAWPRHRGVGNGYQNRKGLHVTCGCCRGGSGRRSGARIACDILCCSREAREVVKHRLAV